MLLFIEQRLATELAVKTSQIQATVQLLDDGATMPLIARYRKEITEETRYCAVAPIGEAIA